VNRAGRNRQDRGEPLSALDACFLYLESSRTPMHSGSVAIFEAGPLVDHHGRFRIEAARHEIEHRLDLVPKLRRRVKFSMLGQVAPVWVDDSSFDVSRHVHRIAVAAPGTEQQLADLCADIMAVPLERGHPLWEMWFVEGLESRHIAVVEKVHHSLADGLAGVELATVLLDMEKHPPALPEPATGWIPSRAPSELSLTVSDLARRTRAPVRALRAGLGAARHPLRSAAGAIRLVDAFGTVVTPRSIAPRSPLNAPIGQGRRVALVRQPMEDLRVVERRFGVTLNDVLLTAVAGGVHRLYQSRGLEDEADFLHVLVPVGTDHQGDHVLGNRVSAMLPRLPVGRAGPVTRLRAVSHEMARCKRHRQALVGDLLLRALDPMPQPFLVAASRLMNRQPFFNIVVTNVPGPPFPLYAMGSRMLEAFPLVPLAGNLSVGVAALSYDRELTVGLTADRYLCEDLEVLARGIERSFAELVRAASRRTGHDGAMPKEAEGARTAAGALR